MSLHGIKFRMCFRSEFPRTKKVAVPLHAVSRVIGRAGCNINAIREASGAHIEMDKQKGQAERTITIKGSAEAMRQAQTMITALINDPDKQLDQLIPKNKHKPNTTTVTIQSNMWHNSMAMGVPGTVPVSTNTGTIFTAQSCIMSSQRSHSSHATQSTKSFLTNGPSVGVTPFANVVKNQVNGHGPSQSAPAHSPSTKRSGKTSVTSSQPVVNPPVKGNVAVARQLFPESNITVAITKTTATYSMASNTMSKMASSTTSTFSMKPETIGAVMSTKVQTKVPPPPSTIGAQTKQDLPLKSQSGRPGSAPIPSQSPSTVGAVYSPFNNNHFTRVAESVLSKKEEGLESRRNFASVAAAGVVSSNSQVPSAASVMDSLLKAPGYKAQANNHQSEPDLSKAPGYRSTPAPNGPLMDQTNFMRLDSIDVEVDPSKAPGYKGHPFDYDFARSPFKLSQSPGSMAGGSPRSMEPGHSPPQLRNEYSTPNHPMTLPKIESTLNPNAPDFTSRSLHQHFLQQQQQRMYQSMLSLNTRSLLLEANDFSQSAAGIQGFGLPMTSMPRQPSPMAGQPPPSVTVSKGM